MNNVGQSVSQMVNVIMSQDSSDLRQSVSGLSVVQQAQTSMNHNIDSGLTNGSPMLSEVANVLSSPRAASLPTPTHEMQAQSVIFKREIMDTEVNPFWMDAADIHHPPPFNWCHNHS